MRLLLAKCITVQCFFMLYTNAFAGTPKIYAVVVGVAAYKDSTIPNLRYSEKDAKDFNTFLRSPYAGAIPVENIALLIGPDATRGNIITSLVDMSKRCTKDDMVIFYFSGHGEADEGDNSGYLLCYDAASNNAPATAISMEEINTRLSKCQAKLKVSYIDACHAGMFTSTGKGSMQADNEIIASSFLQSIANAGDGYVAFLSSSAKQQSQESDKFHNGVFTYYLLKGLEGDADKYQQSAAGYNDGLVTVGEMVAYLTEKIFAATNYNQKPTIQGFYDEDFPLSILSANVQISDAIAKRPEKKVLPVSNSIESIPNSETENKYKSDPECWLGYGDLNLIGNYSEDLFIYYYRSYKASNSLDILLPKDANAVITKLNLGAFTEESDVRFYFKTTDETKPIKYGTMTINIKKCSLATVTVSNKNLYLSTTGERL